MSKESSDKAGGDTGERQLWQAVASTSNPDWNVALGENWKSVGAGFGEVHIYAVDTRTGWVCAATISNESMQEARLQAQQDGFDLSQVAGQAASAVAEAAERVARGVEVINTNIVHATVMSLISTRTYDLVMSNLGSPKGHWLYLVYRDGEGLHGNSVGRPAFIFGNPGALMPMETFSESVAAIIEGDLVGSDSSIGRELRALQGLELAPQWPPKG